MKSYKSKSPETDALRDSYENYEHRTNMEDLWELCASMERKRDTATAATAILQVAGDLVVAAERALGERAEAQVDLKAERALADALAESLEWYRLQVEDCNKTTREGDLSRDALAKDYGRRAAGSLKKWKELREPYEP